jgi:hypothetical protein
MHNAVRHLVLLSLKRVVRTLSGNYLNRGGRALVFGTRAQQCDLGQRRGMSPDTRISRALCTDVKELRGWERADRAKFAHEPTEQRRGFSVTEAVQRRDEP